MNSGSILSGRPSLGAWVNYGLGSANRNLPSFVVMLDDRRSHRRDQAVGLRLSARDLPGHAVPPGRHAAAAPEAADGMTDAEQRNELGLLKS